MITAIYLNAYGARLGDSQALDISTPDAVADALTAAYFKARTTSKAQVLHVVRKSRAVEHIHIAIG